MVDPVGLPPERAEAVCRQPAIAPAFRFPQLAPRRPSIVGISAYSPSLVAADLEVVACHERYLWEGITHALHFSNCFSTSLRSCSSVCSPHILSTS
jgi:hypothetical protein